MRPCHRVGASCQVKQARLPGAIAREQHVSKRMSCRVPVQPAVAAAVGTVKRAWRADVKPEGRSSRSGALPNSRWLPHGNYRRDCDAGSVPPHRAGLLTGPGWRTSRSLTPSSRSSSARESGEYMESEQILRMKDANNPQQQGSAITYARRYALAAIFNLNQEDDDANSASGHKVTTAKETLHPKHPLWAKAVEHIKGGGSIKDIEAKFIISDEYKAVLEATK